MYSEGPPHTWDEAHVLGLGPQEEETGYNPTGDLLLHIIPSV